ncbi:protein FAM210A-like [Lasioglossum baleicum]|uniref:protein FAM210A-like n=1 Tax=Lasioglossum baleicum TaxID=434251 RepID=UPI003FCDBD3B
MDIIFCRGIKFTSTLGFRPILATKNFLETTRLIRRSDTRFWKLNFFERHPHYRNLSCNYVPFVNRIKTYEIPYKYKVGKNIFAARYCNLNATKGNTPKIELEKKPTLFQKMKQMTKDYWHILIPVHVVTSIGWISIFYIAIKNGVDIANIMEHMHFNQKYIDMVRNTSAGTWAIAYLLYKIFTPLRYTVTLGSTTMVIKKLSKTGMVKPLSYKKPQMTTEASKTSTQKEGLKIERQTERPKT